jgi:manganese-dependent inorganic pyrophosphatase
MSGNKVGIAQLSAFNFELLKKRKKDFYEEMQKLLDQQGYKTIILMLTDVQAMGSEVVFTGAYQADIAKAFNLELNNHSGWAAGVMSRKKQVVPLLKMVFKNK